MSRIVVTAFAALLLSTPAWSAGGTRAPVPEPTLTPQEEALELYNRGLAYRDRAWKIQEKAAKADPEGREKLGAKIEAVYGKAIEAYEAAIERSPELHQAWSSLGYARRKTGDLEGSLEAYDRALELAPEYAEAIEYRGEAYLGLGRLEEAREAYMELFASDRERADELLASMRRWLEDPSSADPQGVEEMRGWVEERSLIAEQTAELRGGGTSSRW